MLFISPPVSFYRGVFMGGRKLLLSTIAFTVIFQISHMAGAFLDMPYYTDAGMAGVWSKIMMPGPAPPAEFYLLSIFSSMVIGAIFSFGFTLVGHSFASKHAFKADPPHIVGAKYGLFVFALAGFGNLTMPLLFNIPFGLAFSWALQSLVTYVLAGAAAGKILGKK